MILYLPNLNISTLMLLFFSLGFFSCGQCIAYPTMTEINPPHLTSTALSIVAIILNLGSAIFQPIFGQLMNRHHTEQIVTSYTAHDYRTAMLSLLVVIAVAIILSLKIKETFCKIKASEPVELTAFSNEPEEATH